MTKNKLRKLPSKSGTHFRLPDTPPPVDYGSLKPAFSFREMKYRSKKCLSMCDVKSKASVGDTLLILSQSIWHDLVSRRISGYEKIPQNQFRVPLPPSITPDVSIIVFHFSRSGRIAGFRDKDIYHIVLVSPKHDLY